MANLLLKYGIDLSSARAAIEQLTGLFTQASEAQTSQAKSGYDDLSTTIDRLKAQLTSSTIDQKTLLNSVAAAMDKIKESASSQTAESAKQLSTYQAKLKAIEDEEAAIRRTLSGYKEQTEELKHQLELKHKKSEESEGEGEGEGEEKESLTAPAIRKIGGALLGNNLIANVGLGLLTGVGVTAALEELTEGLASFIEEIKEVSIESGKITILEDQFKSLSRTVHDTSQTSDEMMSKLSEKTEGLVSRMTLLRVATAGMKSPIGFTKEQIEDVSGAVVKLAEAAGNTAEQGMQAFYQALTSGRTQILATTLGMTELRTVTNNMPAGLNRVQEQALEAQKAFALMTAKAASLKDLPITLEQIAQKISVIKTNLSTDFAINFNRSAGMTAFMEDLNSLTEKLFGSEKDSRDLGTTLGNMIGPKATSALHEFVDALSLVDRSMSKIKFAAEALLTVLAAKALQSFILMLYEAGAATVAFAVKTTDLMVLQVAQGTVVEGLSASMNKLAAAIGTANVAAAILSAGMLALALNANEVKEAIEKQHGVVLTWGDVWTATIETSKNRLKSMKDILESLASGNWVVAIDTIMTEDTAGKEEAKIAEARKKTPEFKQQKLDEKSRQNQEDIATDKEGISDAYKAGTISAAQYLQKKAELEKKAYDDHLARINGDKEFTLAADRAKGASAEELAKVVEEADKKAFDAKQRYLAQQKDKSLPYLPPPEDGNPNTAAKTRELQATLTAQEQQSAYDKHKAQIEKEQQENQNKYNDGLTTLAQYLAKKQALEEEDYQASQSKIKADAEAKINVAKAKPFTEISNTDRAIEVKTAQAKEDSDLEVLATQHQAKLNQIAQTGYQDRRAAAIAQANATKAEQLQVLKHQLKEAESDERQGNISPQELAAIKLQNIQQTLQVELNAIATVTAASKQSAKQQIDDTKAIALAKQQAQQEAHEVPSATGEEQFQAIQKTYPRDQATLGAQLQIQQQLKSAGIIDTQTPQLLQQMLDSLAKQKQALEEAYNLNTGNKDLQIQIASAIEKTYDAQVKYNLELAKSQSQLSIIGNLESSLGRDLAQMGVISIGSGISSISRGLSAGGSFASELPKEMRAFHKDPNLGKDPAQIALEQNAKSILNNLDASSTRAAGSLTQLAATVSATIARMQGVPDKSASDTVVPSAIAEAQSSGTSVTNSPSQTDTSHQTSNSNPTNATVSATSALDQFSQKLQAGAGIVTGFLGALASAKTTTQGAVAGGSAGASLGGALGEDAAGTGIGKSISKALGASMPVIGQAMGAALGLVTGAIMGSKQNKIEDMIKAMKLQEIAINQAFATGQTTLNQTIISLQGLIQEANMDAANSKKGSSQFKQLAEQYTQQLNQLQAQQAQIIKTMTLQLQTLSAPEQYQSYLSSLQQLVVTYQSYIGAAKDANDVTSANLYLQQSIANLQVQWASTLTDDNAQAVQDAIALIDLAQQRQDLITKTAQQEAGIMSQGVLARHQTEAQSKAQQISDLQRTVNIQLQTMNEQIAVDQNKVAAESKVFSLATSRIALENQLIDAQNAQTTYSMKNIVALANLYELISNSNQSISSGEISGTLAGWLLNALPKNPVGGNFSGGSSDQIPNNRTPPTSGGYTADPIQTTGRLASATSQAYETYATMGYGGYNGAGL